MRPFYSVQNKTINQLFNRIDQILVMNLYTSSSLGQYNHCLYHAMFSNLIMFVKGSSNASLRSKDISRGVQGRPLPHPSEQSPH